MKTEWSNVLGNSATALEIVQNYRETIGAESMSMLAEWCEAQARDVWGNDLPNDVDWTDIAEQLVRAAAEERVRQSGALDDHRDTIFYDWPEGSAHLLWIALAPEREIVSWAQSIEAEV